MLYPTLQHVQAIIRQINATQNTKIVIINMGQLKFALEKPRMRIYGRELYPQLHQKAAVLMETLTKAHALSDGNKRVAMMVAEAMVGINGGMLVLPLKSIRFSVNTAMDANDEMTDTIQQWFKVHTATDWCSLCVMLIELDGEESMIKGMLKQGGGDDAKRLLGEWMVFDNYPDNRRACDEMIDEWEKMETGASRRTDIQGADGWGSTWASFMSRRSLPHSHYDPPYDAAVHGPQYNHNSMAELLAAEEWLCSESATYKSTTDASLVLQNALRLERYGMYHDAIDVYERLRDLDSDESHAVFHIARIMQYGLGDPESALEYWNIFLKYQPDSGEGNLHVGLALAELRRYSDALIRLEKMPQEYPDINIHKGGVYARMGQHNRAIEFYRKGLVVNPNNPFAHKLMGLSCAESGDHRKALECFDRAIGIRPNYRFYYNKGTALANLGRYDSAIMSYRKALDANPYDLETRINLASATSDSGRPEEAIPYLLEALEVDPSHPVTLYSLALALSRTERYGEALVHVDKAVEMYAPDINTMYLRASILASLGRTDECLNTLKTLAKTDPEFGETMTSDEFGKAFDPILRDKRFEDIWNPS